MKPEEQRIAIAEACGWTQCQWNGAYNTLKGVPPIRPSLFQDIPDYLNDLNAIREAENKLSKDHRKQLVYVLLRVVIADLDKNTPEIDKFRVLYFATAAQRAEAFIRVIGKWNSDA
jgi:hypothetical protein